ncbi:MFS transporter [Brachyspira sp.]|uniref:MFS transporter n=1 Tax=Brachyspira sp. TaxID=1977261 RepID=UPI0026368699|nr:MFS transporter [Brachyspira sp.]
MSNLLFFIMIFLWLALYTYIPFQVTYLSSINVDSSMIGLILGLSGASQMILRFPFGIITDYIGKCKIFVVLGCAFITLGSAIRLIYPNANGFLVGGILAGISASTWMMYIILYVSFFDKSQEHSAYSKSLTASVSGMLIAFIIATISYEKLGMKFLLLISIISGSIGLVLSLFLKDNIIRKKTNLKDLILVVKNKRLLFFSALTIVQQGIQMAAAVAFTLNRIRELGGESYIIGIASILNMVSAIVSAYLSSKKCINRLGAKFYIPIIFLVLALYCIIVITTNNIMIIVLSQILSGFSAGMLAAYLTSESIKEIPIEKKSSAMGFFQASYAIGIFVYPIITGKLVDLYSINIAYILLAASAVLCTILSSIYYKLEKNN